MKKIGMSCLTLFLCLLCFSAYSQYAGNTIKFIQSRKFFRDFVSAPTFEAGAGFQLSSPDRSGKWLVVIFEYVPFAYFDQQTASRTGKKIYNWLDDVSVELYAIVPGSAGYGKNVLLSGSQKIWSLARDGKTHRVFFAVAPLIFQRYSTMDYYNRQSAEQIPLYIVIKDQSQRVIAYDFAPSLKYTVNQLQRLFPQMIRANMNVFKLQGSILPKEKTPWQWLEIDSFEMPKSLLEGK